MTRTDKRLSRGGLAFPSRGALALQPGAPEQKPQGPARIQTTSYKRFLGERPGPRNVLRLPSEAKQAIHHRSDYMCLANKAARIIAFKCVSVTVLRVKSRYWAKT